MQILSPNLPYPRVRNSGSAPCVCCNRPYGWFQTLRTALEQWLSNSLDHDSWGEVHFMSWPNTHTNTHKQFYKTMRILLCAILVFSVLFCYVCMCVNLCKNLVMTCTADTQTTNRPRPAVWGPMLLNSLLIFSCAVAPSVSLVQLWTSCQNNAS